MATDQEGVIQFVSHILHRLLTCSDTALEMTVGRANHGYFRRLVLQHRAEIVHALDLKLHGLENLALLADGDV